MLDKVQSKAKAYGFLTIMKTKKPDCVKVKKKKRKNTKKEKIKPNAKKMMNPVIR